MSYGMMARTKVTVNHPDVPKSVDWDKGSAPAVNHATSRLRPSADKDKAILSGETTRDNITTECMVDPVRDAAFLAALAAGQRFEGTSISYRDLDNDNLPIGRARTFAGCSIEKVTLPEADANSEDVQKLVIEWAVP